MSGKEGKPFEKFRQELKQFFKGAKNASGNSQTQMKLKDEHEFNSEFEHQLSIKSPIAQRIRAIRELSDIVLHAKLDKNAVGKICGCVDDILTDEQYKAHRHVVISFYQSLVKGQYDRLDSMRLYFFKVIQNYDRKEDIVARFILLQRLTNEGRNITVVEQDVGKFLLEWMLEPCLIAERTIEFLTILINYVKYNSGYIDEDVIDGIVKNTCYICCYSNIDDVVSKGLEVLDTVVCYSKLSQQTMAAFISALSRTICIEDHNSTSCKIVRNLLGTHMGHFCLQTLCFMLQDDNNFADTGLISGIIYILNMALLVKSPDNLVGCIPRYILPSILKVSASENAIVLVEVVLCIKWTVELYGKELNDPTWDIVLNILEAVITKIGRWNNLHSQNYIGEIFCKVQELLKNDQCDADMVKLFSFCQKWSHLMPESFIFYLTDYHFNQIVTMAPTNWTSQIDPFISTFLIEESRLTVRVYVLETLVKVIQENSNYRQEEIINNVVKRYFGNFAFDRNDSIRNITLDFLIKLCYTYKGNYMESILDILEKVLRTIFEQNEMLSEAHKSDIRLVVQGLLDIFIFSIYELPSSNAIKILDILVSFLKWHYEKPQILESLIDVRWMIIECLLKLRADSRCRIGYIGDSPNNVEYSCYLLADYKRTSNTSLSSSSRVNSKSSEGSCSSFEEEFCEGYVLTYISLTNACRVIVTALKSELDWKILQRILITIPIALRNRALIFSKYNNEVGSIVNALILMISESILPETLKNLPLKFNKTQFYGYVVPVLSAFASYHTRLEFNRQQRLISCLEMGLVDKSAPQCVSALMICLLEMRDAMVKMLPEILLNLSKITATVNVALPILEFLSLLATFPQVYSNFIPNQYMSIFAIIFPYTNPFKYHHYIVSLAHHVIAVWFLKCRRPLRGDFVKYIIKGVKSHFEENNFPNPAVTNEDSSNRKRSSSLTEQGNRRKERHMSGSGRLMTSQGAGGTTDLRRNIDETSVTFHRELTETCIDLLSKAAYTSCSALPKRTPGSEFLLGKGHSLTWLLGNSIITVTTSGCAQKPMFNGYCDKCYESCTFNRSNQSSDTNAADKQQESSNKTSQNDSISNVPKSTTKQLTRHLSINSEDDNLTDGSKVFSSTENNFESDEKRFADGAEINKQTFIGQEEQEWHNLCVCWCQGWAEIHIRRPTGDTSWIMRLQNDISTSPYRNPLSDISSLYQATVIQEGIKIIEKEDKLQKEAILKSSSQCSANSLENQSKEVVTELPPGAVKVGSEVPSEITSVTSTVENVVADPKPTNENSAHDPQCSESNLVDDEKTDLIADGDSNEHCCHGRNPVRRSNSSPEMSSNWKNSFVKDPSRSFNSSPVNAVEQCESNDQCSLLECKKLGKQCYSEKLRCNCEAIPEEFPGLGTTPPKSIQMRTVTSVDTVSDVESLINSPSPSISSGNISQSEKSSSTSQLPPSSSCENFNNENKKQTETRFFDEHGLPNDDFEFSRSASTSQVMSSFKKHPTSSSYVNLSHGLTSSQPHLTSKPPPSPPIYSLRSMKHGKDSSSTESHSDSFSNLDYKRNRVHTISVMSPAKKSQMEGDSRGRFNKQRTFEPKKSGINPSYVFLQLYDSSQFFNSSEKPILVTSPTIQRSLNVFDLIPPYETHKVGVIYVGPGQANNEREILRNTNGSVRYVEFLMRLGAFVRLADVNSQNVFLGGLEQNGNDGKYAYIWKDNIMQLTFHVATLMPNQENDQNCNNKKKHIGNDYVHIVYNESGEEYNLNTVKCQFNFASIIVEPLDHGTHQLTVKAREDLSQIIGNIDTKIVSDKNVSLLARQLALHINLASLVLNSMSTDRNCGGIYASNWLERLRKIKQIKKKVIDEGTSSVQIDNMVNKQTSGNYFCDFTDYTS